MVEAVHLAEDDHSLHLAFSCGLYYRLDLTSGEVKTVQLGGGSGEARWHFQFVKVPESGPLFLFGIDSQGMAGSFMCRLC